jgi:peptidoglycan/LPS O-acetylase OafA/YrhL
MTVTWYLACDMQMFILSPLLIWPLWRWRRAGLAWVILNIVAFTCGLIVTYATNDLPPTLIGTREFVFL